MKEMESELDWQLRVFDSLSYPTRVLKPDGTIIAVNQEFIEKIDSEAASIIGMKCKDVNRLYSPQRQFPCSNENECPLKRAVKLKKGHSIVFNTTGSDGNEKWEDRVFSPILGDDGDVSYIIESVRDVTRVKILEKMYSGMRVLIDNVVFSSAAEKAGVDFDQEIVSIQTVASRPPTSSTGRPTRSAARTSSSRCAGARCPRISSSKTRHVR